MPSPTGPAEGRLENNLRRVESKLFRPGGGTFSSVDRMGLVATMRQPDHSGGARARTMRPDRVRSRVWTVAAALAVALSAALPRADAAEPDELFFKGKTINFYIGFAGGGSYDFYARLIARYIGKHIPGNPTVVPQTMTGAGSFQLANYLFASAPKDGTAMGTITQTVALEEALHSPGVRYKAAEFNWIGRATAILEIALAGKDAKAKTMRRRGNTRPRSPAPARAHRRKAIRG